MENYQTIDYDYFSKIDFRVAKVLSCQRISGSDKLLKLEVDIGTEKRTIVAGIGKVYEPEYLVNKLIVVVANLEPKTLFNITSEGMLLAASDDTGKIVIISPRQKIKAGAKVK
jgi:methionyl-tRNA synthetase